MKKYYIYITMLLFCWSCKEDATLPEHTWYEMDIHKPVFSGTGVDLSAEILSVGGDKVIEKGFYVTRVFGNYDESQWESDEFPTPGELREKYPLALEDDFSTRVEGEWDNGITCTAQAYMRTHNREFVSRSVTFTPLRSLAPEIHSITPNKGPHVGTFIIKGKNFSNLLNRNRVYTNHGRQRVIKASETELETEFSFGGRTGFKDVAVYVGGMRAVMENGYYLEGPLIKSISPPSPKAGELITIYCEGVKSGDNIEVYFSESSYPYHDIKSINNNEIKLVFPRIVGTSSIRLLNRDTYIDSEPYSFTISNPWEEYSGFLHDCGVIHNNLFYTFHYDKLIEYDPARNTVKEKIGPEIYLYRQPSLTACDNYIFLFAGELSEVKNFKYDLLTDEWTQLADIPNSGSVTLTFSPVIGGNIYSLFQDQSGWYVNNHLKYSIADDKWEIFSSQTTHKLLFNYNNDLYGYDEKCLYKFDLKNPSSEPTMIFKFPQEVYQVREDKLFVAGDILYITRDYIVYTYNMRTSELVVLGTPTQYAIDNIFVYSNQLFVRSYDKYYRYTGD